MHTIDPGSLDLHNLESTRLASRTTFSLLIPARGPEAAKTLGTIIASNRDRWMDTHRVLDEIGVVVDPDADGDEHGLIRIATEAGASWVVRGCDVIGRHAGVEPPSSGGKAGAMRSLAHLAFGSRLIFHDADLSTYDPATVGILAAAMAARGGPHFVNGSSQRITGDGQPGGRTTEMLRSVFAKQLGRFVPAITETLQPLIGEFAIDASTFASLPFSRGYGVETSLKVLAFDALDDHDSAQVTLPVKYQVGQHYHDLVKQFHEISFTVDVLEAYFTRRLADPRVTVWDIADSYELLFPGRQFALRRPAGYDPYDFLPRLGFYKPLATSPGHRARSKPAAAARRTALDQLSRRIRTAPA